MDCLKRIGLCLSMTLVIGCSSHAAILTPTSQSRFLNAVANGPFLSVGDSRNATGFGPFDETIDLSAFDPNDGSVHFLVSQHSRIRPDGISCSGELRELGSFHRTVVLQNDVDVLFTINETTPFEMRGVWTGTGLGNRPDYDLFLTTASNTTVAYINGISSAAPRSGIIGPGAYRFVGNCRDESSTGSNADYAFSWYFSIPAPSAAPLMALGIAAVVRRRRAPLLGCE